MISLFYDDNNKVYLKYYTDLPAELKDKDNLQVEAVDDPEDKPGKIPVLYANKNNYWYKYINKELTEDEVLTHRIKLLADSQNNIEDLLQEIILEIYS